MMKGSEDILPNKTVLQIGSSKNTNNLIPKAHKEAYENQSPIDPMVYCYTTVDTPAENITQKKDTTTKRIKSHH